MPAWIDNGGEQRRRQPRAEIRLDCILTRRKGAPIVCHTLDVGPGGMRVATDRPLGVDEVLHFEVPVDGRQLGGDARVLREQGPNVYALRIETMRDDWAERLGTLASG